jgi:hypothetical protein
VLAFRGSTQAFSDTQLAIWVRNAGGRFATSIARNLKVALMYRDEDSKRLTNSSAAPTSPPTRRPARRSSKAPPRRFARAGVAVIFGLDRVEGYAGLSPTGPVNPVRMAR